ncbi:MAG: inositol monophosphatase [Candidatus Magasanikbacteria bacterium]
MQDFLKQIIREAGEIGKEYFYKGVTYTVKSHPADFLTEADTSVSNFLVDKIKEKYPTHHIKSEEMADDVNTGSEYEWVIDPIDGTWVFVNGIATWGTMIAVLKNGEPYLASVFFPLAEHLFFAEAGKGAYLNDKLITVNNKKEISNALGHLIWRSKKAGPYGEQFERFRNFASHCVRETDIRMMDLRNSASMCYVAKGTFDFSISNVGLDWDRLPVYLICKEAGAIVTDSDGNPWKRGRQDIVIANPDLHPKIMKLFK